MLPVICDMFRFIDIRRERHYHYLSVSSYYRYSRVYSESGELCARELRAEESRQYTYARAARAGAATLLHERWLYYRVIITECYYKSILRVMPLIITNALRHIASSPLSPFIITRILLHAILHTRDIATPTSSSFITPCHARRLILWRH